MVIKLKKGRDFPERTVASVMDTQVRSMPTDSDGESESEPLHACVAPRKKGLSKLARVLAKHEDVESVYTPKPLECPSGDPRAEPAYAAGQQSNLDALGVPNVWSRPGGRGEAVRVADMEFGWYDHPDLSGMARSLAPRTAAREFDGLGINRASHGTQSLTVVAARANGIGMVGIVPELPSMVLAGVHSVTDQGTVIRYTPWGIVSAANALSPGDVLLLEVSLADGNPIELENVQVGQAIQAAIDRGIVVIAAAGNKSRTLAMPLRAIHVGSSWKLQNGMSLDPNTNRGPSVDCCAWGQGVLSGIRAGNGNPPGWGSFTNTSAAAAMVAGVVAGVQSALKTAGRPPMTHGVVRTLLRTPGLGTLPVPGIGSMPHAGLLLDAALRMPSGAG